MSRLLPLAVSRQVVAAFRPHFKPGKVEKMEGILNRRQRGRALILENIHDPHNAAACFRSADAFGFQEVHIIDRYNRFDEHRASNGTSVGGCNVVALPHCPREGFIVVGGCLPHA